MANFFFMGLTIQKIVSGEDEEQARKDMKASYRFRTVTQLLWVVLAVALPFLNGAAGLIPCFSKRRHQGAEYVWNDKCKTKSIERR